HQKGPREEGGIPPLRALDPRLRAMDPRLRTDRSPAPWPDSPAPWLDSPARWPDSPARWPDSPAPRGESRAPNRGAAAGIQFPERGRAGEQAVTGRRPRRGPCSSRSAPARLGHDGQKEALLGDAGTDRLPAVLR